MVDYKVGVEYLFQDQTDLIHTHSCPTEYSVTSKSFKFIFINSYIYKYQLISL